MKRIGFVGAFEKTDLIMYVAKVLAVLKKRVLVVDTTVLQKARYIVPAITPTKSYITTYEDIDVAVGFESLSDLDKYVSGVENYYEFILIDVDSCEKFDSYNLENSNSLYFVTAFDSFSLKKGIEIIGKLRRKVKMKKVLFERDFLEEDDEYLNLLSLTYSIEWEKDKLYFPYDQGDLTAIIENQRVIKIKFKNLSEEFRQSLLILAEEIGTPEIKIGDIKKTFKNI